MDDKDRADEPLTPVEKQVFGEHAKRRPDGSIIEEGSPHIYAPPEEPAAAVTDLADEPSVKKPKHKPKAHK